MSTPETVTVPCQRCRHPMDADAVQCDACGEFQRVGSARDRSGKLTHDLLQSHRGPGGAAGRGGVYRVPLKATAKWAGLAAAGLLVMSGICLGAAWLIDSMTLQLMQSSITAAFAAGAAVVVGVVTAAVWKVVAMIQQWMDGHQARSVARDREKLLREEAKALYDHDALNAVRAAKLPPKPAPVQWVAPQVERPPRPIPSQLTLVFSVLGILCGLAAVMNALMPFLGMFQYKQPLILAVIFTVLAWTLSFYEGSQKLLPSVALSMIVASVLIAWGQMMYWGEAAEDLGNEVKKFTDTLQWQNKPGVASPFATPSPAHQLQNIISTGLNSMPTPPPAPVPPGARNTPARR